MRLLFPFCSPAAPLSSSSSRVYYSVDVHPGWRILVLDSFDVSILGRPDSDADSNADSASFSLAQRLLADHNPNDLSSRTANWLQGMAGLEMRFTPLGGGCSERQLEWIREERDKAKVGNNSVNVVHAFRGTFPSLS